MAPKKKIDLNDLFQKRIYNKGYRAGRKSVKPAECCNNCSKQEPTLENRFDGFWTNLKKLWK